MHDVGGLDSITQKDRQQAWLLYLTQYTDAPTARYHVYFERYLHRYTTISLEKLRTDSAGNSHNEGWFTDAKCPFCIAHRVFHRPIGNGPLCRAVRCRRYGALRPRAEREELSTATIVKLVQFLIQIKRYVNP